MTRLLNAIPDWLIILGGPVFVIGLCVVLAIGWLIKVLVGGLATAVWRI
jgi:hypothetical protein